MILGLMGKKGTGKTEVAIYLISNYNFIERAFADKLKEISADLFDIPLEEFYDRHGKNCFDERWGLTHRQILQKMGTEVGRVINPNVWVYHVKKWIERRPERDIVLSDVRFKSEVDAIQELGGFIWKIEKGRPTELFEEDLHASEIEQDDIESDLVIHNNGSIADLHNVIDEAMKREYTWKRKT